MFFDELLQAIKKVKCEETRRAEPKCLEIVVTKFVIDEVKAILESYFGQPLKPAGQPPCSLARDHSKPYGGIQYEQTMYLKKEKSPELALLWPWGDMHGITVKIIQE
jgi:hypothetical protein